MGRLFAFVRGACASTGNAQRLNDGLALLLVNVLAASEDEPGPAAC